MTNENPWELVRPQYKKYVVATYRPQIENALIERVNRTVSSGEAASVIGELEHMLLYLRSGDGTLEESLRRLEEKQTIRDMPQYSGFMYNGSTYLDVFDTFADFFKQSNRSNREFAAILQISFRGTAFIRAGPPYEAPSRRIHALEKRKPDYVRRFAQYAQLTDADKEHMLSLPAIHPNHRKKGVVPDSI